MSLEEHRNENGTYNGVGVMSEISGLRPEEIAKIAGEVKANHETLAACQYHEFEPNPDPLAERAINRHKRYICKHCGGHVSDVMYRWHELGRRPKP